MPMKISLLKRHEVQVLLRAGHRQKEVAAVAGLSTRTVQRIASEPLVTEFVEPARPRRADQVRWKVFGTGLPTGYRRSRFGRERDSGACAR